MPIINTVIAGGGTPAPAHYIEKVVDANGKLVGGTTIINTSGVDDIGDYSLAYAYYNSTNITSPLNMSSLTKITGSYALFTGFYGCGITSIDFSNVEVISGTNALQSAFSQTPNLQSFDFSKLKTISGYAALQRCFNNSGITTFIMPALESIVSGNAFTGICESCNRLTTVKMNKLTSLGVLGTSAARPFGSCVVLESVELGGLTSTTFSSATNQLQYLFNTNTGSQAQNGCTVHFPSNFDPSDPDHTFDASTLAGYPTFGGDAQYIHVAFDLPATE